MSRIISGRTALVALTALALAVPATAPTQAAPRGISPGAPGVGDPYFPHDGNGGYDARHYRLRLSYDPGTGRIAGTATIRAHARQIFRSYYLNIPAGDPFWKLRIGDPGPAHLFDGAVYIRGAMTVQRLRERVGDHDFFRILRRWPEVRAGRTGSTPQFVRLAERISGERLGGLFHAWLYMSHKPAVPHAGRPPARTPPSVAAALHRLGAAGLVR